MSDLFDKQRFLDDLMNCSESIGRKSLMAMIEVLKNQPAIEAEPVRHGEWVHLGGDEWCCTECGNVITTEGSWEKPTRKFCDECGAKMREDGDEKRRTNND